MDNGSSGTKTTLQFGLIMLMSTFSGAILAANKPEFIMSRWPDINTFIFSLYDVAAYSSYFIGLLLGMISDWKGERKKFITIGACGSMIGLYFLTVIQSYPLLLVIRFIEGVFSIMIWQTLMVLNLDYSNNSNRAKNMGIMGFSLGSAMAIGSMVGGLIAQFGVFIPYYFAIVFRGLVLLLNLIWIRNPVESTRRPPIKESILLLKTQPKLIVPGIFNLVDRLHMGFIVLIIPLFALETFQLSTGFRGMILGLVNLPALLLMYKVGKKSDSDWGRFKPLVVGSLGYGVFLSLTGFLGQISVSVFISLILIQSCFSGITTSPASALVGDLVGKENNGMATSLFNFMGNIGIIIGPLVGGFFVQYYSYSAAFLVAGAIELVSLGINIIIAKKLKFLSL